MFNNFVSGLFAADKALALILGNGPNGTFEKN